MDTLPTEPFLIARLPLPPSANHLYKTVPWKTPSGHMTSRRVATADYLAFQQDAISCLSQAEVQNWQIIEHIRACKSKRQFLPLKLEVVCYLEHLWKRDEDNPIKALQDVIFGKFLAMNDTLVTDLDIKKRLNPENPHCKVRLSFAQEGGDEEW